MTDYPNPIDVHLAAGIGPPLMVGEARERVPIEYREDDDSYEDEALTDDELDEDDDSELDDVEISSKKEWPDAEHVVINNAKGGAGAKCLHCSESFTAALPVKLTNWLAQCRAFVLIHAKCKPGKIKQ